MEKLGIAYTLLRQALATLKKSFNTLSRAQQTPDEQVILGLQDSTIQRFEYSYDAFWKFLKRILQKKYSVQDANSSASVFKMCIKLELCSEQEGRILQKMIYDRNITTHDYNIEEVRKIFPHIKTYYDTMVIILDRIANDA